MGNFRIYGVSSRMCREMGRNGGFLRVGVEWDEWGVSAENA